MSNELQMLAIDGITIDDLVAAKIIPANTPPAQIQIFAAFCKETGLSAINKECYLIANENKAKGTTEYFVIASIAGVRRYAHDSGVYLGKSEVMFDLKGNDTFKRMSELNGIPKTATIIVYKNVGGFKAEFPTTLMISEYLKPTQYGKSTHDRMPMTMIAKAVEMHALRAAFSQLGKVYIEEELAAINGETVSGQPKQVIEHKPKEKAILDANHQDWEQVVSFMKKQNGETTEAAFTRLKNSYTLNETVIETLTKFVPLHNDSI